MTYKNQAEFESGDLMLEEILNHQWSSRDAYDAAMANWIRRATTGLKALADAGKRCSEQMRKAVNDPDQATR